MLRHGTLTALPGAHHLTGISDRPTAYLHRTVLMQGLGPEAERITPVCSHDHAQRGVLPLCLSSAPGVLRGKRDQQLDLASSQRRDGHTVPIDEGILRGQRTTRRADHLLLAIRQLDGD